MLVIHQLALAAQCVSQAPAGLREKDSQVAQCATWCSAKNADSQCGWCKCQACPHCKAEQVQSRRAAKGSPESPLRGQADVFQRHRLPVVIPEYFGSNVGLNNEKMILRRAAVVALALNGSLCCPPMVHGKTNDSPTGLRSVSVGEVYDMAHLGCLPRCPAMNACEQLECLQGHAPSRIYSQLIAPGTTEADAKQIFVAAQRGAPCLVLRRCLWPFGPATRRLENQLWEGHLRKPKRLRALAQRLASDLFGNNATFTSVHLRFEEIHCARVPFTLADVPSAERVCLRARHPTNSSVSTTLTPSVRAIVDAIGAAWRAAAVPSRLVFLATDGRARGRGATVDALRADAAARLGLTVRELRDVPRPAQRTLSAVAGDGDGSVELETEIEQLVCAASALHVGSSTSSWDWEVAYLRYAATVPPLPSTHLAHAELEFEDALALETPHFAKTALLPPVRTGRMYMLDRLLQEGLYGFPAPLLAPRITVGGNGDEGRNRGYDSPLDATQTSACRWRAAKPGSDTVTAVDLGAFCALWPFVLQPCANDVAALTAPAQPWALLKARGSVRKTGLWPYCGMREPYIDSGRGGTTPKGNVGNVAPRPRNVYTCGDDDLRSYGANTSLATLLVAMGRSRLVHSKPARVRAVFFLGDSLVGQYTDVIACAIANRASFRVVNVPFGNGHTRSDVRAPVFDSASAFVLRVMNVSVDGIISGDGDDGSGHRLLVVHVTTVDRDGHAGQWVSGRLEAAIRALRLDASETVVVANIGLHYLVGDAGSTDGRYAAAMAQLVSDVERLAPLRAVWVRTTAVHMDTMTAEVDAHTRDKFERATGPAIEQLNNVADEALRRAHRRLRWSTVDAFALTTTRPDGLFPGDVRHYRSEVIEAISKQIFISLLGQLSAPGLDVSL